MKKVYVLLFFLFANSLALAEIVTGTDELAHLPYWELREQAMTFRLVQRLPDQTRAYFSGRGFSKEDTKYIASYCFFQTVFKNSAPESSQDVIEYDLNQWLVVPHIIQEQDHEQALVVRERWQSIWHKRNVHESQRIAFNWSLLPTRQKYQTADYNWGMTVFNIPHGAKFDLKMSWVLNGKKKKTTIKNLQCAKDIYLPPPEGQ